MLNDAYTHNTSPLPPPFLEVTEAMNIHHPLRVTIRTSFNPHALSSRFSVVLNLQQAQATEMLYQNILSNKFFSTFFLGGGALGVLALLGALSYGVYHLIGARWSKGGSHLSFGWPSLLGSHPSGTQDQTGFNLARLNLTKFVTWALSLAQSLLHLKIQIFRDSIYEGI